MNRTPTADLGREACAAGRGAKLSINYFGVVAENHRSQLFFQAEDGIRDLTVTGVQTCALPICQPGLPSPCPAGGTESPNSPCGGAPAGTSPRTRPRSEERRVGKEGRSRWA